MLTTTSESHEVSALAPNETRRLRWIYLANLGLATLPGAQLVAFPVRRSEALSTLEADPAVSGMLGGMWLTVGVLSGVGLRYPQAMAALVPFQIGYKSIWLVTRAIPRLISGDRRVLPLTLLFAAMVLGYSAAFPWRSVFARKRLGKRVTSKATPAEPAVEGVWPT